jgi:hypothetical protein
MNEELKGLFGISDRIKERVMNDCKITRVTLWNWLNGNTPIPFWAKEKIDAILIQEVGRTIFSDQESLTGIVS